MSWVWGEPKNPGEMTFKIGTLLSKDHTFGRDHWAVHPIRKWFGVTIADRLFIGVTAFDRRKHRATDAPQEPSHERP